MGSLFKPSQNTSSGTSSQSWGPPPAYQKAYRDLLNRGVAASKAAYDPATERMEGLTAAQQAGASGVYGTQGAYAPYLASAGQAANFGVAPITQQAIQDRMSPYLQNVVNATQRQFGIDNARQLEGVRSQMAMQGALGGTRGNVAEALTREAQMNAQSPVIANLYQQGYSQAEQNAQADAQRSLQGAGILGNIGGMAQQYGYGDVDALFGLGGLEREAADIATANAAQRAGYEPGMLNWAAGLTTSLGNAAGGTSSGTTTQTTPGPSMGQQLLGAGLSIAGLFSDARLKRDVEEIGKTHDGQSIYRYRMGDDPTMRIGLMAQEVEGHHPEAVGSVGGLKVVDYGAATKDAVRRDGYETGGVVTPFKAPSWLSPMQAKPFQQSGAGQAPTPSLGQASGSNSGLGGLLESVEQAHSAFGKLGQKMRTTESPGGWSTTVNPSGLSGWGNYLGNMGQQGLGALSSGLGNLFGFSHGGMVRGYEGGGVVDMEKDATGVWAAPVSATLSDPPPMGGFNPFGFSDPVRRGMIAAGLGMMASQSPNFGVAVGEGGMQGMKAYDDAQNAVMAHEQRKIQAAQHAAELANRARQIQEEMALKREEHAMRQKELEANIAVQQHKAAQEEAAAKLGKVLEVDKKLVQVMPDGTVKEIYAPPPGADQPKFEKVGNNIVRIMPDGSVEEVYRAGPDAGTTGEDTADVKNYKFSQSQGFSGTFDEWRRQNRPDGIPNSLQTEAARASQAFDTLGAELDDYEKLVAGSVGGKPIPGAVGSGVTWMPGAEKDSVLQKRRNIQLQLKELYNLGVLNGPDLQLMDTMLFDPEAWDAGIDTSKRAQKSVMNLKSMMERLKNDKVRIFSSPLQRPPATSQSSSDKIDIGDGFSVRVK